MAESRFADDTPVLAIDLRGTPCPLNFVRSRLALEKIPPGAWLQVDLDAGEPERMVSEALRSEGHRVELAGAADDTPAAELEASVRLWVCRVES